MSEVRILAVLKAYFDKSGQHQDNSKFFTLCGVAATDDLWAEIEPTWLHILSAGDPKAAYMHVVEAINLRNEFKKDKGWDDPKVWALINALVSYITTLPRDKVCQFISTVDMDAYRKLQAETYQMDSPVDICITSCVTRVMFWYLHEYRAGVDLEARYYFDKNEPFEPVFKANWIAETEKDAEIKTVSIWTHIRHVGSSDMRTTPGLQVADMLAWGSNREENEGASTFPHIALTLRSLVPTKSVKWDESMLRKRYRPLIYRP